MKKYIPIVLLALALCAPAKAQSRSHAITNFVVFLSGTNEVPPNHSLHFGYGWFNLDGNVLNFAFNFLPSLTGLDSGLQRLPTDKSVGYFLTASGLRTGHTMVVDAWQKRQSL